MAIAEQKKDAPRRFYLITYPRTASNLLVRILNLMEQPDVEPKGKSAGYFFMDAMTKRWGMQLESKPMDDWTEEERNSLKEAYQQCVDEFVKYLDDAEAHGKIAFIKEHAFFMGDPTQQWQMLHPGNKVNEPRWTMGVPERYGKTQTHSDLNNTVFPDEFLRLFKPIFLVRHPALMFSSLFRASRDIVTEVGPQEEGRFAVHSASVRQIYKWFEEQFEQTRSADPNDGEGDWPVILDADDVINDPGVILRLCELTGLDKTKLRYEWDKAKKDEIEELDKPAQRMLSTLNASNGIMKEKTAGTVDIDAEVKKWEVEFGEETAAIIEKAVRDAMPFYEYMKARRLRA